jgi:uncharacterized protein involved in copper resistance
MKTMRVAATVAGLAIGLALWGCDKGDAGAPARDHSGTSSERSSGARPVDNRPHTPPPLVDGKPMWADNRQHTAMENLDYQFGQWGSGFGAKDARDYAKKAIAFTSHPPARAEKLTRPNGDTLYYDKASNTFAIVRRDGAPRLFRKPPDGIVTWEKAKAEAASGGSYRSHSRYHAPGSGDYRGGADN